MKVVPALFFLFSSITLHGQTGTIKVKKSGNCDFKIISEKYLFNKAYEISQISVKGLTKADTSFKDDLIIAKSNLYTTQNFTISKDSLSYYLRNICDTPTYKLVSVKIIKADEQATIFVTLVFKDK